MDLRTFLLARYVEDEAEWREFETDSEVRLPRTTAARVLADVDSKRLIVEAEPERWVPQDDAPGHTIDMGCPEGMVRVYGKLITEVEYRDRYMELAPPSQTLLFLSIPYADHPDYRQEWADALAEAEVA